MTIIGDGESVYGSLFYIVGIKMAGRITAGQKKFQSAIATYKNDLKVKSGQDYLICIFP
jgi:hypothetical protein